MPGPLTRIRQLAAKIEYNEGVAVVPAAADCAFLPWAPKINPDVPMFKRMWAGRGFGRRGSIAGRRMGTVSFQVEMRGSGSAGTAPKWWRFMQACGMADEAVLKLTIGAIAGGPFRHGESVSQAVSGATGRVIKDTATGILVLYVVDTYGGTWNGTNVITGATSGATTTPSALSSNTVRALRPYSELAQHIAIGAIAGGPFLAREEITGAPSGAKGEVIESTVTGSPVLRFVPVSGQFASADVITGTSSLASATASANATQGHNASLTMHLMGGGTRRKLRGCRGKVKGTFKAGEPVLWTFDFMGVEDGRDDSGPISGVTHETTLPPAFRSAGLVWGTYAARCASLDLDLANTVSPRLDFNDAKAVKSAVITDREWAGRLDPESVKTTVEDWWTKWFAGTEVTVDFLVGSAAGNSFEVYADGAQIEKDDDAEREGMDAEELAIGFNVDPDLRTDGELVILAF